MQLMKVPERVWEYLELWKCNNGKIYVSMSRYSKGLTSLEITTGETPDISEYLDFEFYDWVNYLTNAGLGELSIGWWIGVLHKVGQIISY